MARGRQASGDKTIPGAPLPEGTGVELEVEDGVIVASVRSTPKVKVEWVPTRGLEEYHSADVDLLPGRPVDVPEHVARYLQETFPANVK